MHGFIVVVALTLVAFNAMHELPHFFSAVPLNGVGEAAIVGTAPPRATPLSCTHVQDSPIWLARLPFFLTYFIGASACSATLAMRYHMRSRSSGGTSAGSHGQ